MIEPYAVVALQSDIPVVKDRGDYPEYIAHLASLASSAVETTRLEHPVNLIVVPEASFQGFRDEFTDMPHAEYARDFAIDIPGRETQALGRIARRHKSYLVASAKGRHPAFPDRFFNVAFILSPEGELVHRYYKLQAWVKERSVTPHDVLKRWIELHGNGPDAFFPVARLPIGNIGTTICMEGSFPEIYRGLALNGAEIITRPSYPEPWVSQGVWEIQNRARAVDNTCYVIAPNQGTMLRNRHAKSQTGGGNGGQSMIVDYRGGLMAKANHANEGFIAAIVDVDGLRRHRARAKFMNFLPYLRTELYASMYGRAIWPADTAADREPGLQAEAEATFDASVATVRARQGPAGGDS
jgi:predicted amidohydrolase